MSSNIGQIAFSVLAVTAAAYGASAPSSFTRIDIHNRFVAEGVAVADFNQDGKPDLVAGYEWFEGPDFKVAHRYRDPRSASNHTFTGAKRAYDPENYSDDFLTFAYDFNKDGWIDILVVSTPGEDATWFENPGGKDITPRYQFNAQRGTNEVVGFDNAPGAPWPAHVAIPVLDTESPGFEDIDGDGRPDVIGATGGRLGYFAFDPANPTKEWAFHPVSGPGHGRYTHGVGVGDVNGDGRLDYLERQGWWEQPRPVAGSSPPTESPAWKFHAQAFGTQGGAQMYVYDVNGDGANDVITSMSAHAYGLSWFEQRPSPAGGLGASTGESTWIEHKVLGAVADEKIGGVQFSQPHAVLLEDMDGDGLKDIVTGKRYLAHGSAGDADPLGTPVLYYFRLARDSAKNATYTPVLVDSNSGVGTQFAIADLNGDRKPDIAVVNKHGAVALIQR